MNIGKTIKNILKEQSGFTPRKNPPKNIKSILNKIELFEVYPKIFAVVIKDDKLRARVFMRYQEFYESDSDSFRGKGFKWNDFVKNYKKKTKKDYFSYHEDWAGYNIPCDSIEACVAVIPDLNYYDLIMFSIVDTIKKIVGSDKYYLIGIDQTNGEDPSLIYHEIAHGLWFSSIPYKGKQMRNIMKLDEKVKNFIARKITGMGYSESVVDDEIQAYLSTGVADNMVRIKNIKNMEIPFKEVFNQYTSKISPKKIQIDWSVDLEK